MAVTAVDITIESIRLDEDGGEDAITTFAKGKRAEYKGVVYVDYDEPAVSGLEGTHTLLKWYGDRLLLSRRGAVAQQQEFCAGCTSECLYETSFIVLPMKAETRLIESAVDSSAMDIYIEYFLTLGGEPQGLTKLRILVREDVGIGYKRQAGGSS